MSGIMPLQIEEKSPHRVWLTRTSTTVRTIEIQELVAFK